MLGVPKRKLLFFTDAVSVFWHLFCLPKSSASLQLVHCWLESTCQGIRNLILDPWHLIVLYLQTLTKIWAAHRLLYPQCTYPPSPWQDYSATRLVQTILECVNLVKSWAGSCYFLPSSCLRCCSSKSSRWSARLTALSYCSRSWDKVSSFLAIACFTLSHT